MRNVIVPLIFIVFLFSACSGNEDTIKFEDKSFANTLIVQKVEGNSATEEMTKIVKDKEKIEKVLSVVEDLKVKKINNNEFNDKLKTQNVYMFAFIKGSKMDTQKGAYAFNVLEDGTILFNYDNVDNPNNPVITIGKHKDLLNEMKQMLEIDF